MTLQVLMMIAAVLFANLYTPPALADSYSSVTTTTEELQPVSELRETRTFVEDVPATTVIREQPVIITQPADREVVVIKQRRHHLIHIGPVRVF